MHKEDVDMILNGDLELCEERLRRGFFLLILRLVVVEEGAREEDEEMISLLRDDVVEVASDRQGLLAAGLLASCWSCPKTSIAPVLCSET